VEMFRDAIDTRLFRAGLAAREHGRALVVVTATPLSLDRLTQWMAKSREQGMVFAPASALAQEGRKS
ncbi:MAG TPA: divergent polysaccharide deacetylase family protein, partial [Candidatus Omnitrophota bacterium]|nr:divergent polysaccharide deacetylase family protein [Candidatus Omnitrophota bacterium]